MTAPATDRSTILERGKRLVEEQERQDRERDEQRDRENREHPVRALVHQLKKKLRAEVDTSAVRVVPRPDTEGYDAEVEVEGLTFGFRRPNEHSSYYDEDELCLLLKCAKGCGTPLWAEVSNVADVYMSATSTAAQHQWACTEAERGARERERQEREPQRVRKAAALYLESPAGKIAEVEAAAERYANAVAAEDAAIKARNDYEADAVAKLVGEPNPMTGKPHSEASARRFVQQTAVWRGLEEARCQMEREKIMASARLTTAQLRARLAVTGTTRGEDED